MKKFAVLLLLAAFVLTSLCCCTVRVDKRWLYGVHADYQDMEWENLSTESATELIKMLGAKVVRFSVNCNLIMSDSQTFIDDKADTRALQVEELTNAGIDVLLVNSTWFLPADVQQQSPTDMFLPSRDLSENSDYMRFLTLYETMWKNMAAKFPTVKYWQTGNETNQPLWFHKKQGEQSTLEEYMEITVDMMYVASRAIKSVNENAIIVMPALAPLSNLTKALDIIYKNIESGSFGGGSTAVDDYFNIAAWHPYQTTYGDISRIWRTEQQKRYNVCIEHNDGQRRVIFTETGFQDSSRAADWQRMFGYVKNDLPFVDGMIVYCLTSHALTGNNYGIFGTDAQNGTFLPGKAAYALQELFGGSGDLAKYAVKAEK